MNPTRHPRCSELLGHYRRIGRFGVARAKAERNCLRTAEGGRFGGYLPFLNPVGAIFRQFSPSTDAIPEILAISGCIPHFVRLRGLGVGVDPGLAGLVAEPEGGNWDGVAEVVGS